MARTPAAALVELTLPRPPACLLLAPAPLLSRLNDTARRGDKRSVLSSLSSCISLCGMPSRLPVVSSAVQNTLIGETVEHPEKIGRLQNVSIMDCHSCYLGLYSLVMMLSYLVREARRAIS